MEPTGSSPAPPAGGSGSPRASGGGKAAAWAPPWATPPPKKERTGGIPIWRAQQACAPPPERAGPLPRLGVSGMIRTSPGWVPGEAEIGPANDSTTFG